jgi:heavy metal sensor kinase
LKLLWLSFPLVALSAVCGWFVAGSVTSGVERVAAMADAITAGGDLGRRLPAGGGCGEIEDLALSFNAMLSRLEKSIREIEEVSDNIAHDLRTPLTRIKGIMETTVAASPKDVGEYREMCGEVLEECDRMVAIVDTMLEITRTDSGVAAMDLADVDVGELLDKARELFLPLAEAKGLDLKSSGAPDGLTVRADKAKLQRAIANLIDNAVKYTPEGGSVEIGARSSDGRVEIFVADTGTGVPPKERKNVFKRFYRCDSSRSLPGNGLGLSLARAIARAHSGDIRLESGDGESVFTIELPAS